MGACSGLKEAASRLSSSRTRFGGEDVPVLHRSSTRQGHGRGEAAIDAQASPLYPKDGNGPQRPKSCTSAIVEQNPLRRGSRVLHRSSTRQGHGRGEAAIDAQASPLYPKDGNGPQRPKSCTSAIVEQNPLRRGSRVLHRSSTRQGHGREKPLDSCPGFSGSVNAGPPLELAKKSPS